MMQFDRVQLGRQAKELGFVRDTFEKVSRLADILRFMEQDGLLSSTLALKGGTAINLTIFDLPRLSVDIDLDYAHDVQREEMLAERKIITERIEKYMRAAGYRRSLKSKYYHALDSFVYEYQNAGEMKDNLKIEINYMLRAHVLPVERRKVALPWLDTELTVLSVAPLEIYASKIVALLNRTAPRDLYDVHNMLKFGLFDESEQEMLRRCIIFYSAIGSDQIPTDFQFSQIENVPQYRIKTDLLPVLRRSEVFDLKLAQAEITEYLSGLLVPTENELAFWQHFRSGEYRPELIFGQSPEQERVSHHAMALWKCEKRRQRSRETDISL
ncbi:MAG: nucleotidyl transferase AbiEii/AbiGii toxin family protein [Oscillospiraceae bacterium]|nr:nucleotidyl transferase AbiEii/AbiGii toxin family protein [Oscillospiraceae bacterium]